MSSDSSDTKKSKAKMRKKYQKVQWTDSETEEKKNGEQSGDSEDERRELLQKSAEASLFGWVNYVYSTRRSPGDLRYIHDLSWEHGRAKNNLFNPYQFIRKISLLALIACYVLMRMAWPISELWVYFSSWTLHIQTLSLIYTMHAATSQTFTVDFNQ